MKKEKKAEKAGEKLITPKKDFKIFQNEIDLQLKKGEPVSVPVHFLENLKTENVI